MRLTATKLDVVTRTPPLAFGAIPVARVTADGMHGPCRLQAHVDYVSCGPTWTVQRYAYRLTGGAVRRCNRANVRLVSDGAIVYAFETPPNLVNDGRWYVHEHLTEVPEGALTYSRFEAWFDVPGLALCSWRDAAAQRRLRRARDRDPRGRLGPRSRRAQDVERATQRA